MRREGLLLLVVDETPRPRAPQCPHRPRLVDGDEAPRTTDYQAERVSRQEPHDDNADRAPCATWPHEEPGLRPQTKLEQLPADGPRSGPFLGLLARRNKLCRLSHLALQRALGQLLLLWAGARRIRRSAWRA